MVEQVNELLEKGLDSILSSAFHLKLLKVYSLLYLNGGQPRVCSRSARRYFDELSQTGLERAKNFENMKARTNKPKWIGRKFIAAMSTHYSNEMITDEQATMLLKAGHLKESDFEILPEMYTKKGETRQPKIDDLNAPKKESNRNAKRGKK